MKASRLFGLVASLAFAGMCVIAITMAVSRADYNQNTYGGTVTRFKTTPDASTPAVHVPHVNLDSMVPAGATQITASATGTTLATAATLAAAANVRTFICGFSIIANATAAATGNATVAGTVTGTMNFTQFTPANTAGASGPSATFYPCVPSSAANTAIVVTSAAPGAGGVISVTAWGYRQ